jgi:hypothetical protein
MGVSKFRDFIKRKLDRQPTVRCRICFNFTGDKDDDSPEYERHTLEGLYDSAEAGCFTCAILRDAVRGVFGDERFPLTQPVYFKPGYGRPALILSDLDNRYWQQRPTIHFYYTGT